MILPHQDTGSPVAGQFPVVPQQDRALSKRRALLDSAQAVFAERGYEKTTAREIAAHAGVAIGTFYRYFTDKRQVFVTILHDNIEELLPSSPQWLKGDPEEVVFSLLQRHSAKARTCGLSRAFQELHILEPDMAGLLRDVERQAHERLVDGLRQARDQGLTWPDIDLESTAWAIYVLVYQVSTDEGPNVSSVKLHSLAKLICRMVMPPETLAAMKNEAGGNK